jgi:cytoplasmic iron level regulating protein YaaA (DUF328/UPF0246 family)
VPRRALGVSRGSLTADRPVRWPTDSIPATVTGYRATVFVLLPPSETKAPSGSGGHLNLGLLRFPGLTADREAVIGALTALCTDRPAARRVLSVAATKDPEIAATAELRHSPTLPALARYTGVLYDALDVATLPPAARARANRQVLITSALFGLVAGDDPIPAYRLSAGSLLPGIGGLPAFWRPRLAITVSELDRPLVDLRSSAYAGFAPIKDAIVPRVVTEGPTGQRSVVSHFNKATKGLLARALMLTRADIVDTAGVLRVARRAGLRAERTGEHTLDVLT